MLVRLLAKVCVDTTNLILDMGKLIVGMTFYMSLNYSPCSDYPDTLLDPKIIFLQWWLLFFYFSCLANTTCILRVINSDVKGLSFLLEKHKCNERLLQSSFFGANNHRNKAEMHYKM